MREIPQVQNRNRLEGRKIFGVLKEVKYF